MNPRSPTKPARPPLLDLDEISARLEAALERSVADETELVWLEAHRRGCRRRGGKLESAEERERTILVRVLNHGRIGSYRTGAGEAGDLDEAIRQANAQSRVRDPLTGLPHLPADGAAPPDLANLHDPEVAALEAGRAGDLLTRLKGRKMSTSLRWAEARVAVVNSRGVRRAQEVTAAAFNARTGGGRGRSADAARRLGDLDLAALVELARRRHGRGAEEAPASPVPAILAPGAVAELLELLSQTSFSAKSYYDGTSFLREHLNVQVFDRRFELKDDGTDPRGLPFPFDLEGTLKHPVELIAKGAPRTPTLDQRQAAILGLPATGHAIGGNNARAENLLLEPGADDDDALLAAAEGGLWIGALTGVECFEPRRVKFRARVRGARRVASGRLGAHVSDFVWEDSLLRVFSSLPAIGSRLARRPSPDGYLGGIAAPAVVVTGVERRG